MCKASCGRATCIWVNPKTTIYIGSMITFILKGISYKLIVPIIIIGFLSSCSQPVKNITYKTGEPLITETVIDNQAGTFDSTINYCFHLPKAYNGTNKLPVVFFFDPHADGNTAIDKYASLSNKYGYIFIASNNIKNGQTANQTHNFFVKLLNEAKHRFIIDENRLYTAGFSGGAKLAIIFAQQMPQIIGVAACGASLPFSKDYQPNYYYAGIVGNKDFNYLEAHQTFLAFNNKGFDYTSVVFDGGHIWPPTESFEMGLIGFNIYAIKTNRAPKNNKWLDGIWKKMNDSITVFNENNSPINENVYLRQTIRWFYGIKNMTELNKRAYEVENSTLFLNHAKKRQKLIRKEVELRSEFIRAMELRDLDWWEKEVNRFNESIKKSDKDIAQISQRLLNYLSMVGFMLTKTDLDNDKLDSVEKKLKIYELVDAGNPDVYLMFARYYMLINDTETIKQNFKKAQKLGFKDYDTYKTEASWKTLFEREDIIDLYI